MVTASPPCVSPPIVREEVAVSVPATKFPAVVDARYARLRYAVPVEVAFTKV